MNGPLMTPKEFMEIENLLSTYGRYVHAGNRPIALRKALNHSSRPVKSIAALGRELDAMRNTQRQERQSQRSILQKAIASTNGHIQSLIGKIPAQEVVNLDLQLRTLAERASHL